MHQHHDTNEASAMSAADALEAIDRMIDRRDLILSDAQRARTAVAALIAERDAMAKKWTALYSATLRHAEAIQQCRQIESAQLPYKRMDFLLEQARFEYSDASRNLWALIDAARAEAHNG